MKETDRWNRTLSIKQILKCKKPNQLPKKSLKSQTVTGMAWMLASNLGRLAMRVGFFAIFARLIAPDEYGVFGAALVVISFSSLISELGVTQSLIQKPEVSSQEATSAHYFCIFLAIVIFLVLQLLTPFAGQYFDDSRVEDVLRLLTVILLVRSCCSVSEAMLVRNLKFKFIAVRETAVYLVANTLIGIPLACYGYGVWTLVWVTLGSEILRTFVVFSASPVKWNQSYDHQLIKPMLKFGAGISIAQIFNRIALQIDNIIVGRYLGMEALGYYGRAYQLVAMPANLFGDAAAKVLFPALSKVQNDQKKLQNVQLQITNILATVILPSSALIWIASPQFIVFLLGEDWQSVIVPFQILSLGIFFRVGYKIVGVLARSTGKVTMLAVTQIGFAALVAIGAMIGVSWGVPGVASGVLTALIVNYVVLSCFGAFITGLPFGSLIAVQVKGVTVALCLIAIWYSVISFTTNTNEISSWPTAIVLLVFMTYQLLDWKCGDQHPIRQILKVANGQSGKGKPPQV